MLTDALPQRAAPHCPQESGLRCAAVFKKEGAESCETLGALSDSVCLDSVVVCHGVRKKVIRAGLRFSGHRSQMGRKYLHGPRGTWCLLLIVLKLSREEGLGAGQWK